MHLFNFWILKMLKIIYNISPRFNDATNPQNFSFIYKIHPILKAL